MRLTNKCFQKQFCIKMSETETSTQSDDSAQLMDGGTSGRTGKQQYRVPGTTFFHQDTPAGRERTGKPRVP